MSKYFACAYPNGELGVIVERTGQYTGWVINGHWDGVFKDGKVTVGKVKPETFDAPIVWEGDELIERDGDYGFRYVEEQMNGKH